MHVILVIACVPVQLQSHYLAPTTTAALSLRQDKVQLPFQVRPDHGNRQKRRTLSKSYLLEFE